MISKLKYHAVEIEINAYIQQTKLTISQPILNKSKIGILGLKLSNNFRELANKYRNNKIKIMDPKLSHHFWKFKNTHRQKILLLLILHCSLLKLLNLRLFLMFFLFVKSSKQIQIKIYPNNNSTVSMGHGNTTQNITSCTQSITSC